MVHMENYEVRTLTPLSLLIAMLVASIGCDLASDACSTWVPLNCGDYVADTTTAIQSCDLSNTTLTGIANSFDCGLRPTSPRSSLTYCVKSNIYEFVIPAAVRNRTKTIVTLIGADASARLSLLTDEPQIHVILSDGVTYSLGSIVPGYNALIGQQTSLGRPTMLPSNVYSYPFNGYLTCSNQVAYQPWRVPGEMLSVGVAKIRVYDPRAILKVYSVTVDTCDSYVGPNVQKLQADTWMGDRAINASIALDEGNGGVSLADVNAITSWPQCTALCYSQQGSASNPCVGYVFNSSSRNCYILESLDAVTSSKSQGNGSFLGVLPPVNVSKAGAVAAPDLVTTTPTFPQAMLTRPDLFGQWKQHLYFGYRSELLLNSDIMLASTRKYALSITQANYKKTSFIMSYVKNPVTGAGGRISVCGGAPDQPVPVVPFLNNNTIAKCQDFGHCPPVAVGGPTSGFPLGALRVLFEESPVASNATCASFSAISNSSIGYLMLLSQDGSSPYEGGIYSLADTKPGGTPLSTEIGALASQHGVSTPAVQVKDHLTLQDGTTLFTYHVSGFTPSLPVTSPRWFWSDEQQRTQTTNLFCDIKVNPHYDVVRGNQGNPGNRYRCNVFSSLHEMVAACNADDACLGFTMKVYDARTESPWCMINNATIETIDPLALNNDTTLMLKAFSRTSSTYSCNFPTYGGYDLTVNIARGLLGGTIVVKADDAVIATCAAGSGQPVDEASCRTFTPCFTGSVPLTTSVVTVQLTLAFPLRKTCSAAAVRALVTFGINRVYVNPPSSCVANYNATRCSNQVAKSGMNSYSLPLCGSATRLTPAIGDPATYCTSQAVSTPSKYSFPGAPVFQTMYTIVDFTGVDATVRGSAQFAVVAIDGLDRGIVLGYITKVSAATRYAIVGLGGLNSESLCSDKNPSGIPASLYQLFTVPRAWMNNGIPSLTIRGVGLAVLQVSGFFGNSASCTVPTAHTSAIGGTSFSFIMVAALPTVGLILSSTVTEDFTACAEACDANSLCAVFTYYSTTTTCVLRNAAGSWQAATAVLGNFVAAQAVVSGTKSRAALQVTPAPTVGSVNFIDAIQYLFSSYTQVVIVAIPQQGRNYSIVVPLNDLTQYQVVVGQSGFSGNGHVISGSASFGIGQVCGNNFDPFLSASQDGVSASCDAYRACNPVVGNVAAHTHLSVVMSPDTMLQSPSGGCSNVMTGAIGFSGSDFTSSAAFSRLDIVAGNTTTISAGPLGTVVLQTIPVTYKGTPSTIVVRESPTTPNTLSPANPSSMCRIVTQTIFVAHRLSGYLPGTGYACGQYSTADEASAKCRDDPTCYGFTVGLDNSVGCLTNASGFTSSSTVFFEKVHTRSCVFQVQSPGVIAVTVLNNNLHRTSGNNVVIRFRGSVVKKCGASRPFTSGYSTATAPQCGEYLECFNDYLPGIGALEVVFPDNSTTACDVFAAAIVTLTAQPLVSQLMSVNAPTVLPNSRTIKISSPNVALTLLQSGITRVAVQVKQDRFFAVGVSLSFALNVSIGGTALGLCGGSVGFLEGPGLSGACTTYYYCGSASQGFPVAVPDLKGPLSIAVVEQNATITTYCGNRFEALVMTDGMLATAMPSRSNFRMLFGYVVSLDAYAKDGGTSKKVFAAIASNLTNIIAAGFPCISNNTATVFTERLFPVYKNVESTPNAYLALIDDIYTNEESKTIKNGRVVCMIDALADETVDSRCEIQLEATQNKISVSVAQSNFNSVTNTISVLVNDQVVATCGGDTLFYGYQGLSGLCDNYFVCYEDWITPGALVQVLFSAETVGTSTCSPAVTAFVDVSKQDYIVPVVCNGSTPFTCNADRKCLTKAQICDDVIDCSDRSDEGKCKNWKFAGTNLLPPPLCRPMHITQASSRDDCVRTAVVAQDPIMFLYNQSTCAVYSCLSFTAPNLTAVVDPYVSFEMWIYTTDVTSFLYCLDALHCNNNGIVASSTPPCVCSCADEYTGESCGSQLDLSLIESVVGVLQPNVTANTSVQTSFMTALLGFLPTGSIAAVSSIQVVDIAEPNVTDVAVAASRRFMPSAVSIVANGTFQLGLYTFLTDYTGAALSNFVVSQLLTYSARSQIVAQVPGLQSLTASSIVGPTGRVSCYKLSLTLEGNSCSSMVNINATRSIFVTMTGISFTSYTQFADVTLTTVTGNNATIRCEYNDFVQFRNTAVSGVCGYRSVCAKEFNVAEPVVAMTLTVSRAINPGSVMCNGYVLVSSARVTGAIALPFGDLRTDPSYDSSHSIAYAVITAALGSIGLLCCGLLVSWFRIRHKYEKLRLMGPLFALFAFLFIFGGLCGLAFFVGSETISYSHMITIEKYRDPFCAESYYSPIPTRVSFLNAASPTCEFFNSIGQSEAISYARATFLPQNRTHVVIQHGSQISCLKESGHAFPLNKCIPEALLFPNKNVADLQFIYLSAYTVPEGRKRLSDILSFSPTLLVAKDVMVQASTAGEQFDADSASYRYYVGTSQAIQRQRLPIAGEPHFALLSSIEISNEIKADLTSLEHVIFNASITTTSTALSSAQLVEVHSVPYLTTKYGISNVGVTFNGFNTTSEAPGSQAVGSYKYFGVSSTSLNGGTDRGMTISFWLQATPYTRGLVYAVVDTWITSSTYSSRIVERLITIVENGGESTPWFESDWSCYHMVYVSGESNLLVFATASVKNGFVRTVWDLKELNLLRVFDNGWHLITIAIDNSVATSPTARLFVDGETRISGQWLQCISNPVLPISTLHPGDTVKVINNRQEFVKPGGVLVLGALNARLFDFTTSGKLLTQDEIVQRGAPGMELYSEIARVESLGVGIATLLFVLINLAYGANYIYHHFFGLRVEDLGSESDDNDIANVGPEASSAKEAADLMANADTSFFTVSVPFYQFIQPVLLSIQVMALYMYAWEWPATYTNTFFGFFALLSFDLNVAYPSTSRITWPLIQFGIATVLFFWLIFFAWRDREAFQATVLQFQELLRLRQRRMNPFSQAGGDRTIARPVYHWVIHEADGKTRPLTDEQEETLLHNLRSMMARRLKTEANMRLHTPRLIEMGDLGTGILLYERVNGKIFISFRASDRSAAEDREATSITLTQTTIECISDNTQCPEHNLRLLPDDLMQYTCVHSSNPYYRSMECPRKCIMFCCPNELCDFAVCEYCYNGSAVTAAVSGAIAALNHLKKRGILKTAGTILVELASSIYLPVVKSSMMIIGCHSTFICIFGDCWLTPHWPFVLSLLFAFTSLIFFGAGYFVVNALVTWERHFTLRSSLPNKPVLNKLFSFLPDNFVREVDFQDYMQLDETLLVTFYQPFYFNRQWFPVVLYIFRFVLPAAVFITDSGGLPQICAAVVLEAFLSISVNLTSPYKSVWIEMLSRVGSLHQLVLLGLMSLHRVDVKDNPGSAGYGSQMVLTSVVYLGIVGFLLITIVVVPALQQQWEAYKRKKREEGHEHREENYDAGVWGQHTSRATQEIEMKKRHDATA